MNWKPFNWLLDNFVTWLNSHKMDKSKHHMKWDCIFFLSVLFFFVFISYLGIMSVMVICKWKTQQRGGTLTPCAETLPAPSREAEAYGFWCSRFASRLWCPPCSVQIQVLQQAGVVLCHRVKIRLLQHLLPLLKKPASALSLLLSPFLSCHLLPSADMCVVLSTFPRGII